MWAKTPFIEDVDGKYFKDLNGDYVECDSRDVVCLLTRLRALVNERWPGAGVSIETRTIPDPKGTRVCVELANVPGEGEEGQSSRFASPLHSGANDAPPPDPQSPLTVRTPGGTSRVLGTRGTTETFAVPPVMNESASLAHWIENICNTLPDMALAFTALERENIPLWYQIMILRFQFFKLKASGMNVQILSNLGENTAKSDAVLNYVGYDPAIGEGGPLHWFVHKSKYDPELPYRIENFILALYRSGIIMTKPALASTFGLSVLLTTSDNQLCLAHRPNSILNSAEGIFTNPRILLLSS